MTKADKNKIPGKKNFNGIERLVKYIERGFNITNIDHFLNQIEVNMY